MQASATLIGSALPLLHQIKHKATSSPFSEVLDKLLHLLNQINSYFLEQASLDSQLDGRRSISHLPLHLPQHFVAKLIGTISPQKEGAQDNAEVASATENDEECGPNSQAICEFYRSLTQHIKSRWNLDRSQNSKKSPQNDQEAGLRKEENFQELEEILRELLAKLKAMLGDKQQREIDTDSKSKKKSFEEVHHSDFHEKSSVRSLLTEKLKNLQPIQQEDDVSCVDGKILVKSNWIMREMKENSRGNATEPLNNLSSNASEPSLWENARSVGLYPSHLPQGPRKTRFEGQRGILQEINFDVGHSKEKKVLKEKSGCAQCDIY